MNFRTVLLATSTMGLIFASPALAQDSQGPDESVSGNDIIVTAQRVEQRLQDVPISITVFNQSQLDNRNVFSAKDLATYTPSLSTNTRFGNDSSSFAIRGFSQELRTTASVGTYFADVVAPRGGGSTQGGDGAGPGNFFDLQNVQVLKGPQGTLFGRNTTGGAVLLVPKKPTDRLEGYLEGSLGNYDMHRLQAVLNVPLSDNLKVRAGIDWNERNGFLKNVSGIGPKDFADIKYIAGRFSVLANLTPDIENYTVATYSKSTPNGLIPKLTNCFAPNAAFSFLFPLGTLSCQQMEREAGQGWNAVSNSLPDATQQTEQWQVSNTTTWKASDTLTIKNIVSYAQFKQFQRVDLFGTNWILPATLTRPTGVVVNTAPYTGLNFNFVPAISITGRNSNAQSTFTEELQFQGRSDDGRFTWQAGAYFELSKPLGLYGAQNPGRIPCTNSGAFQCTNALLALGLSSGTISYQGVETEFRDIGLYVQASYDLTEQLKFTGGIRYTWDRTRSLADKVLFNFPAPTFTTAVGQCLNPLLPQYLGTPLPHILPNVGATADCREFQRQDSRAPTWLLGLDYKASNDILLYAKWVRGYRQGATNPFGPEGLPPFEQEKVDTYEIGAKTSFRGAVSGTFNISGFYNDFTNQQLSAAYTIPLVAGANPNAGIVNVGKSRIYGFEIESAITPFRGFTVQASYAYLNSRISELAPPPSVPTYGPPSHLSVVGGKLPFTPEHKLTIGATYTLPLEESVGKVSLGVNYAYNGEMFYQGPTSATGALLNSTFGTNEVYNVPAYGLWDINASWNKVAGSNVDIQFFMTNVANKHYFLARNQQQTSGFISRYLAEPRIWGFKLRYNFSD